MKQVSYEQAVAVVGSDPAQTAKKLSETLVELRECHPRYDRVDGCTFFVYYTIDEEIPENNADRMKLRGLRLSCGDCPHCIREMTRFGEPDMRKKTGFCDLKERKIFFTSEACERRYNEYEESNHPQGDEKENDQPISTCENPRSE